VNEMNVERVDLGDELRQGVETCFLAKSSLSVGRRHCCRRHAPKRSLPYPFPDVATSHVVEIEVLGFVILQVQYWPLLGRRKRRRMGVPAKRIVIYVVAVQLLSHSTMRQQPRERSGLEVQGECWLNIKPSAD
jgi:hypothetical protein